MKVETLQRYFNRWVRERDKNKDGTFTCISCGEKIVDLKKVHSGHLLPVRWYGWLRFDPYNCNVQCAKCNFKDGNWLGYLVGLKNKIGEKRLNDLLYRGRNKPNNFKWNENKKKEVLDLIS